MYTKDMPYTLLYIYYYTDRLSIWLSVDPLADKYPHLSPYAYCADNPVMLVDPDGRDVGDPNSSGVPAKKQENGIYTSAQSTTYNPPNKLQELKANNKLYIPKKHNLDGGTIKPVDRMAHLSDFEKQAVRSPIIRGIAVGAATVTIATGAAVVAESAAAIIPQTAAAIAPQAATILSSPAVQKSAAVGAGFLYSTVTGEVQDLPTLTTGISAIDNGFQIGQTAQVFLSVIGKEISDYKIDVVSNSSVKKQNENDKKRH